MLAEQTADVVIHCAGISSASPLTELDAAAWDAAFAVNVRAAFLACQWVASRGTRCDVVLVGGLDRTQSLPLPVHYAASQGALSALAMAAAHELGPKDIRINVVALGPLESGMSEGLAARKKRLQDRIGYYRAAIEQAMQIGEIPTLMTPRCGTIWTMKAAAPATLPARLPAIESSPTPS